MKFDEVRELVLKNDIHESIQDKSKFVSIEKFAFQGDYYLLQQEFRKKYNELRFWFQNEKNKLMIKHNQKLQKIKIQ